MKEPWSKQTCNRILTNTHLLNFTERNGNNRRKDNPGAKGYIVLTNNESFIVVCLGKNQQINNGCYKQTAFNNDSSGIPVSKPLCTKKKKRNSHKTEINQCHFDKLHFQIFLFQRRISTMFYSVNALRVHLFICHIICR